MLIALPWRATIGKKLLGLEVLKENLNRLSFKEAYLRCMLSLITYSFFIPALMMFFNNKKQMLHDRIMKTIVVDNIYSNIKSDHSTKKARGTVQKTFRFIGISITLLLTAYVVFYMSVMGSLMLSNQRSYNNSFKGVPQINDYNDSNIIFYQKEAEKYSADFIEGKEMYEIFEADVKKDISLECILYFVKTYDKEAYHVGKYRVAARNKYANTGDKIKKAKKNEAHMGDHFYTYDINIINGIYSDVLTPWKEGSVSLCEGKIAVDKIYNVFLKKYIEKFSDYRRSINSFKSKSSYVNVDANNWLKELKVKHSDIFLEIKEDARKRRAALEKRELKRRQNRKKENILDIVSGKISYISDNYKDIDLNVPIKDNKTALMLAVEGDEPHLVDRLLLDGAKIIVDGKSAFDFVNKGTKRGKYIFGSLRIAEVREKDVNNEIVHFGYIDKTDTVSITLKSKFSCVKWDKLATCKVN